MARPQRNNVDYFPFLCEEGKKMYYLEETYGNDGFAVFVKILRELAKTDYHYLNLSKKTTLMFLSAKCKVSLNILESIIQDLVDLEKFDSELWNENKIIWCQDFIDSIQDAYVRRSNVCIDRKGLMLLIEGLGIRKPSKCIPKQPKLPLKGYINPQSIVEDSKVNKTKEDISEIYLAYPSKCPTKGNSTSKASSDKDKIKILLKSNTKDYLISAIKFYVDDCIKSKTYMKNFKTFLNNIPDVSEFNKTHNIEYKNGIVQASEQEVIQMLGSKEMYSNNINSGFEYVKYNSNIYKVRGDKEKYIFDGTKNILV